MKNTLTVLVALIFAALLFTQCKKEADPSEIYNAGFYSNGTNAKFFLYIDDVYKGELPYFAAVPTCEQLFEATKSPLYIQLNAGEYDVIGKDESGTVVSSSTLKINKSTLSSSGTIGGLRTQRNGDCVMIGLFE